ncbi:MAG: hypothetical protein QM770_05785 [Tepidisphaeraceae bacterium]
MKLSELGVDNAFVAGVGQLVQQNKIAASKEIAKQLITAALSDGSTGTAEALAQKLGLIQSSDTGAVDAAIDAVLATNPPGLADYKGGKQSAIGSLIGLVMKQSKGLNPKVVGERLREAGLSEQTLPRIARMNTN